MSINTKLNEISSLSLSEQLTRLQDLLFWNDTIQKDVKDRLQSILKSNPELINNIPLYIKNNTSANKPRNGKLYKYKNGAVVYIFNVLGKWNLRILLPQGFKPAKPIQSKEEATNILYDYYMNKPNGPDKKGLIRDLTSQQSKKYRFPVGHADSGKFRKSPHKYDIEGVDSYAKGEEFDYPGPIPDKYKKHLSQKFVSKGERTPPKQPTPGTPAYDRMIQGRKSGQETLSIINALKRLGYDQKSLKGNNKAGYIRLLAKEREVSEEYVRSNIRQIVSDIKDEIPSIPKSRKTAPASRRVNNPEMFKRTKKGTPRKRGISCAAYGNSRNQCIKDNACSYVDEYGCMTNSEAYKILTKLERFLDAEKVKLRTKNKNNYNRGQPEYTGNLSSDEEYV